MNQMITPEATYASAIEYMKMNDDDNAILIINDFILNSKKKYWTPNHEMIMNVYIDLLIKKNKQKLLKDALNYYRNISQVNNIESFQNVLSKTKDLVEEKLNKTQKSYNDLKFETFDLDSDHSPELLYSLDDHTNIQEMADLINSQKFIWETYKILLDFTKTNNKLLNLYSQILKSAFSFCKENKRKAEFKRLCDSVRGYLQTLIKTEKKTNFQNKVQISKPEVLKNLIQIRINLLDTATQLEQWQEAFKTAEDTIFLMDKYERQNIDHSSNNIMTNKKNQRTSKIPILMKSDFYSNIEKLLLISDYPLYHAYSTILIKDLNIKIQKTLKSQDTKLSGVKDVKNRLENLDLKRSYDNILLSALSTPFYNYYTNYLKIGEELYEHEKEIETETCSRMMSVLKLSVVPSRKNLINYIKETKISDHTSEIISELFYLFENEKNPLKIASKGSKIIEEIRKLNYRKNYTDSISKNLVIKTLANLSDLYENISFSRLKSILKWVDPDDLENTILENSRLGLISCSIDHENDLILFNIRKNIQNNLNEKFLNFLNSIEKVGSEIIFSDIKNKKKLSNLRNLIFSELNSYNSNSLSASDALLSSIGQKTKQLEDYIRKRDELKNELIEKKIRERNEQKEKVERETKAMKELLKDEKKQKEFDIQLKKFLIDRIKVYTNTIIVDNKKLRLEEILKDLSKVKDETLIKVLEKEEVEFKTKKEKRFKELSRDCDYLLRELRKRDLKKYSELLRKEEEEFNKNVQEEEKKNYEEKIKFKSNLEEIVEYKEEYFKNIEFTREREYEEKFNSFKTSLNERVKEEFIKDVGLHFKNYIEEFRKEEEEAKKKQISYGSQSKTGTSMIGKGMKFVKGDDKPKAFTSMEINKGEKFTRSTEEPKSATTQIEFKKGIKYEQPQPSTANDTKLIKRAETTTPQENKASDLVRGIKTSEIKEERKESKKAEDMGIVRGTKAIEVKEEKKEIKKGEDMVLTRGTKLTEIKDEKKEIKKPEEINIISRGKLIDIKPETNTFQRASATVKDGESNTFQRGSAITKDAKPAATTPQNTTGGFARASNPQTQPKPAASTTTNNSTDNWRKK